MFHVVEVSPEFVDLVWAARFRRELRMLERVLTGLPPFESKLVSARVVKSRDGFVPLAFHEKEVVSA